MCSCVCQQVHVEALAVHVGFGVCLCSNMDMAIRRTSMRVHIHCSHSFEIVSMKKCEPVLRVLIFDSNLFSH